MMQIIETSYKSKKTILALGAESSGNFSIFHNRRIYYGMGFGSLQSEENLAKFTSSISACLKKHKLKPEIVLIDLHPYFVTQALGQRLSQKFGAKLFEVQHHLAHIFAVAGEYEIINKHKLPVKFLGIACDGTGFGEDEKIWGGEIFKIDIKNKKHKRIGHLENQILLGGEQAIIHPARMLVSILNNFLDKNNIYKFVKKYYTKNEFELLYNQLKQKFNCVETSSTGRVLDSVSVLLGATSNKVGYKHEAINHLEKISSQPYNISAAVEFKKEEKMYILKTTNLFKFLVDNFDKDKKKLAATAQLYLAKGIDAIIGAQKNKIFFGGGLAKNKIISEYLIAKGAIANNELLRGDDALSFGQLIYYLKIL